MDRGPFNLEAGQWNDDTSMALCLATSLIEKYGFDPLDQMLRYVQWWWKGYLSSNGYCFDIGLTVSDALSRFEHTGEPYSGSTDRFRKPHGKQEQIANPRFHDSQCAKTR